MSTRAIKRKKGRKQLFKAKSLAKRVGRGSWVIGRGSIKSISKAVGRGSI